MNSKSPNLPPPPSVPSVVLRPGRDSGTFVEYEIAFTAGANVDAVRALVRQLKAGHEVCFASPDPGDSYLLARVHGADLQIKTAYHGCDGNWRIASFDEAVEHLRPVIPHYDGTYLNRYGSYCIYPDNQIARVQSASTVVASSARHDLMTTEPISLTGTLSLQDLMDINRVHSRMLIRWPVRLLMAVVSVLIAALIIVAGRSAHFVPFSFVVLALCAYFPFGWILSGRWALRRRYHRNRDKFTEETATFTGDAVCITSAKADVRLTWDHLSCVVATPRGLLFLLPPHNIWFWLPQRVFEGNDYRDAVLKLATEHKIRIRRMS